MTDEEKLENIDSVADMLLDKADLENVGRIAHKILKLFAGQNRADCLVAFAYALAWGARDCDDGTGAWAFLGVARIMQRIQADDSDDEDQSA